MVEQQVEKQTSLWSGICGIVLLVCGIGSAGTGFAWIHYNLHGGHGLWSGVFLIVPGILGIVVWTKRNRGVMIGFLTMCIIAIILSTVQAILTGTTYSAFGRLATCPYSLTFSAKILLCPIWRQYLDCCLAITIFNSIGAILALAGSILGCISACSYEAPRTVIVQQPAAIVSVSSATAHQSAYVGPMGYPQYTTALQPPQGYVQQPGGYPQQLATFSQQQQQQQPPPYSGPVESGPPPQYKL